MCLPIRGLGLHSGFDYRSRLKLAVMDLVADMG